MWELESFPAFATLPTEIQDVIWGWALPSPQILHVNAIVNRLRIAPWSVNRFAVRTRTNYDWLFVNQCLDIVALRVCRQSRAVAQSSGYRRVWLVRDPSQWRWFNVNYDMMFLNASTSAISTSRRPDSTPLVFPVPGCIGLWKNLAVSEAVWTKWPFMDLHFSDTILPVKGRRSSSRRGSVAWEPWPNDFLTALKSLESLEIVLRGERLRNRPGTKFTFIDANRYLWRQQMAAVEESLRQDRHQLFWPQVEIVEAVNTQYVSVV